jgi:hypothetical protein
MDPSGNSFFRSDVGGIFDLIFYIYISSECEEKVCVCIICLLLVIISTRVDKN